MKKQRERSATSVRVPPVRTQLTNRWRGGGLQPHRTVLVFPGVEMQRLTMKSDGSSEFIATVHGVAKAKRPRVSVVYELRSECVAQTT